MRRFMSFCAVIGAVAAASIALTPGAYAAGKGSAKTSSSTPGAIDSGFKRGGYSYSRQDTINTYGDSRTLFGGANAYRDPALDRQTQSGPFDHGWFFDSGRGGRGGNSPYWN